MTRGQKVGVAAIGVAIFVGCLGPLGLDGLFTLLSSGLKDRYLPAGWKPFVQAIVFLLAFAGGALAVFLSFFAEKIARWIGLALGLADIAFWLLALVSYLAR